MWSLQAHFSRIRAPQWEVHYYQIPESWRGWLFWRCSGLQRSEHAGKEHALSSFVIILSLFIFRRSSLSKVRRKFLGSLELIHMHWKRRSSSMLHPTVSVEVATLWAVNRVILTQPRPLRHRHPRASAVGWVISWEASLAQDPRPLPPSATMKKWIESVRNRHEKSSASTRRFQRARCKSVYWMAKSK